MTTIVAVENRDHILIGSDTQITAGYQSHGTESAKVFTNGEYTFGVAGRFRMLQAVKHARLPKIPEDLEDVDAFVSTILGPFINRLEKDAKCDPFESVYMTIIRGRIYLIDGDGTYVRNQKGIYSVGSGSTYALGALSNLEREPTEADVLRALRAAEYNDIGTSGPFHIQRTER